MWALGEGLSSNQDSSQQRTVRSKFNYNVIWVESLSCFISLTVKVLNKNTWC